MAQRVASNIPGDWLKVGRPRFLTRIWNTVCDLPWYLPGELLSPPLQRFWLQTRDGIGHFFGIWGPLALGTAMLLMLPVQANISDQPKVSCVLSIPSHPLDSGGLATPWVLSGSSQCKQSNSKGAAFVEAVILDTDTGQVAVYDPLVITRGTKPAAAPVVPALPDHQVTAIWATFNGDHLNLSGPGISSCSQKSLSSPLPQIASCNASAFFQAAQQAIQSGKLQVPSLGKAKDGEPCPTSRDFSLIPDYHSINSGARYLVTSSGATAQYTAQNMAALPNATKQFSGGEEGEFRDSVNKALGCSPPKATDLADPSHTVSSIALSELQASAAQGDSGALTPLNAPFVSDNGKPDIAKLNNYRAALDQPTVSSPDQANAHAYCFDLLTKGLPRIVLDKKLTVSQASPDPSMANSLYTLEALRFHNAYSQLGCDKQLENVNPITLKMEKNIVVGADIDLNPRSTAKHPVVVPVPSDQNVSEDNPTAQEPEYSPWHGWNSSSAPAPAPVVPEIPGGGIINNIFAPSNQPGTNTDTNSGMGNAFRWGLGIADNAASSMFGGSSQGGGGIPGMGIFGSGQN